MSKHKNDAGADDDVKPLKKVKKVRKAATQPSSVATAAEDDADLIEVNSDDDEAVAARMSEINKLNPADAKNEVARRKLKSHKQRLVDGARKAKQAAQVFTTEDTGFLKTDEDDSVPSYAVRQVDILDQTDQTVAAKRFSLELDFGPYRFDFGVTGRELIVGGRKGHIGVFDWLTKDLVTETNVFEAINDVAFLHVSTLYATAQKRWVHIYDEQGVEMHCMKAFNEPKLLEFLPRHLLLVATTGTGFLHYLDVSTGEIVASFRMKEEGNPACIARNDANGIVLSGGASGQVSMWSPNVKEPLVNVKCHSGVVRGLAVDESGRYFATGGNDSVVKVFDIRNYQPVSSRRLRGQITSLALSQTCNLAVGINNKIQIFDAVGKKPLEAPYMTYSTMFDVRQVQFCPHEDVLGIGHAKGYDSIIVPGSGDPHVNGYLHNPFESKNQRREREVKMLLDKIQPQLICLDPSELNRVRKQQAVVEELPPVLQTKPDPSWPLLRRFKRQ